MFPLIHSWCQVIVLIGKEGCQCEPVWTCLVHHSSLPLLCANHITFLYRVHIDQGCGPGVRGVNLQYKLYTVKPLLTVILNNKHHPFNGHLKSQCVHYLEGDETNSNIIISEQHFWYIVCGCEYHYYTGHCGPTMYMYMYTCKPTHGNHEQVFMVTKN